MLPFLESMGAVRVQVLQPHLHWYPCRHRCIHLCTSNMWELNHGYCKKKIASYMYSIYETYDHVVIITALHIMHKSYCNELGYIANNVS